MNTAIKSNRRRWLALALGACAVLLGGTAQAGVAQHAHVEQVDGIRVVVYPMDVKDVVTMVGTMPLGDAASAQASANPAVPALTAMLLQRGTTKHDKFAIAESLSGVGAELDIEGGSNQLGLYAKSLTADAPMVLGLLAEQLRMPAFKPEELAKAKTQLKAGLIQRNEDTNSRASEALTRSLFPIGSPNAPVPREEVLKAVDGATLDQVKAFYRKYYGPAHMTLVFAGDVDPAAIRAEVAKVFAGWQGGVDFVHEIHGTVRPAPRQQTIAMKDKATVSVMWGETTGLRYADPDYLALNMGVNVLGSGFTGRLMARVRDKEGLTYGIGAQLFGSDIVDGGFLINTTFAPQLLDKGVASTRDVVQTWWDKGITAKELDARKENMIGRFQIYLGTTDGMAQAIMSALNRGLELCWIDAYPARIKALTVAEVNAAIRKHLDPARLVRVEAGSFDKK